MNLRKAIESLAICFRRLASGEGEPPLALRRAMGGAESARSAVAPETGLRAKGEIPPAAAGATEKSQQKDFPLGELTKEATIDDEDIASVRSATVEDPEDVADDESEYECDICKLEETAEPIFAPALKAWASASVAFPSWIKRAALAALVAAATRGRKSYSVTVIVPERERGLWPPRLFRNRTCSPKVLKRADLGRPRVLRINLSDKIATVEE